MDVNNIACIMAVVLILSGIAFSGVQLYESLHAKELVSSRSLSTEIGPIKFNIQTTYPGLIMIGLGVLILLAVITKGK